jgi:hypothetical protein
MSADWQHHKGFPPLLLRLLVEAVFLFAESYLIKPIQRILKYPLLLVQLKVSGQEFLPKASSLLTFWLLIFFYIKGRQRKMLNTVSETHWFKCRSASRIYFRFRDPDGIKISSSSCV